MGVSLLDLNIFERKCILTDIDIKLSARIENGVKQLLALVTQDGDLVLHYNFGGVPPILKHIPWYTDSEKVIQNICFDPSATWLLVTTTDVSLYIIPALNIVDPKQKIDCKWSLSDATFFPRHDKTPNVKPLCIIWWQTLDSNQNAIIGHDDGSISFVSLTDGQNIGLCNIASPVQSLNICQDNHLDSVTLLITNSSRQQWRLLLEQRSTAFLWSPDCGNKIQTAVEYAINGLTNGHLDESKSSRSRLQGLKQLSVEKLASLKQKLAETRARGITGNSKIAEDQKSTGSNDSNSSQTDSSIPEKLSHLYATFLSPQFARNRHLFSGYYKPSSILTIHGVHIDLSPMFVHKLFPECWDILVTDRFFYIVNEQLNFLSVVSCQYSETRLDGDNEFDSDSLISQFRFENDEKILSIYKLSDLSLNNESSDSESSKKVQKTFVLAKSESELNIRKPKIDTCIVVTNKSVYKIGLRCSVIEKFVHLVTEELIFEKAERLAIMFGLSVQQLLEYSGDLLLSQERFKHAITLYRLSKCRILKSVLKFAVSGHCYELLGYITVCLTAANAEMSMSTKNHLSNLAIMCYTELLLRSSVNIFQKVTNFKRFINFLAYNEYYDEVLAVNVVCQTELWSILTLLGRIRCLSFDIIEVLCRTMKNPPIDRTSSLLKELDVVSDSFHNCISDSMFLQCLVSKPQYSKVFLNYIKENVSSFSVKTLKRLSNSLDPSRPVAWPIISKVFQKHKCHQSSSLDSTLDSMDSEPPDEILQSTHDLIETFICVLIVLISKRENDTFDINLLNFVETHNETENTLKPPLPIFSHPKPRVLSSGYYHVGLIRNSFLYTWGSSSSGCLGFGPMVTKYSLPQQVDVLNCYQVEALSVACGKNHTLVLTNFGVFSWGSNAYGQLGISTMIFQASYPTLIESLSTANVIDITAGQYHNLALTAEGKVFSWGWGVHGQLGHADINDSYKPKKIIHLADKVVTQIAAGHAHSVVLSSDGVVYSFGSNSFGQLGNGSSTKSCVPVQILLNEKIILIATNYFHSLAVGFDNKLYMWGASPQVLRHQVHNYKRIKVTQQVDKNSDPPPEIDWALTTPFSIDNNHLFPALVATDNVEGQIVQISTGCNHSALLTKDGSLYTWGQNFDGQIGNGSRAEVQLPTVVKVNPLNTLNNLNAGVNTDAELPLKCTYVSCGAEFTIAVDYTGKVLSWGNNSKAQLGKISDEDERSMEGKMVILKSTKRVLKIPKTGQSLTDSPKEVLNLPTLHITYRNNDKLSSCYKNIGCFYPLRKIENISTSFKIQNNPFTSRKTMEGCENANKESSEVVYIYGQKTLHYVLQTYFGLYDTELILHKCVDFKNFQAASKISYLDGHYSDSLGFQLTCFKQFMDGCSWEVNKNSIASSGVLKIVEENPGEKLEKIVSVSSVNATTARIVNNPVSVISTSCSLESIKQFNDELYSQGGCEEMCGEGLEYFEPCNNTKGNINLKSELIDKLELANCEPIAFNLQTDISTVENKNVITSPVVEFSTDAIRKTVVNYVESLDVDLINCDGSSIPNLNNVYKNNSLQSEFERLCPAVLEEDCRLIEDELINLQAANCASPNLLIKSASEIVEFYCSRPQILENHILMQNILIKCMQFWLTNNLPVDELERILLKNMDKYFYPLSILLFCKNFNNNLGEGMVKDSEVKKTQKSFEFLKQLSTKFCLQLCSMVLQNVNKA